MTINFLPRLQRSWVATGVAVVGGVAKYASGRKKEKDAINGRNSLTQPFYEIQNEYEQNRNIAGQQAQGGLPVATKDYYTSESHKGLTAGIQGILKGGGNPNDVSKILDTYDNGIAKIASLDATTHLDNIKTFMTANKDLAGQKTTQFGLNKLRPFENAMKQFNAAQYAGEATKWEGIGDIENAAISYGQSQMNKNLIPDDTGTGANKTVSTASKLFANLEHTATAQTPNTQQHEDGDPANNSGTGNNAGADNSQLFQEFLNYMKNNKGKF